MKQVNLTWKADGIIDSYTIYRAEDESLDVNNLPPPLIAGVTVKGYTDNYVGDATSIHYRIASVKGERSKISGEYIVEIGENAIPTNEFHFITTTGTIDYSGVAGDQLIFSDGTTVTLDEEYLYDIAAPAGKHKVVLKESREASYVGLGGEALVELHNFPTLSSVDSFDFFPNNASINLIKVPNTLPPNITSIGSMFQDCSNFNQDISMWDVSKVDNMNGMFCNATAFNQPLDSWDVSNVTGMDIMFYGAVAFNQPIGNWNTSNVTNMSNMFRDASSFNQDLSQWCVTNITSLPVAFDFGATSWTLPRPVWGTCPSGETPTISCDGAVNCVDFTILIRDGTDPSISATDLQIVFDGEILPPMTPLDWLRTEEGELFPYDIPNGFSVQKPVRFINIGNQNRRIELKSLSDDIQVFSYNNPTSIQLSSDNSHAGACLSGSSGEGRGWRWRLRRVRRWRK